MKRNINLFDASRISTTELVVVPTLSVVFLAFQTLVVGLIPAQVFMVILFNIMFFAHATTRKLAVALIPFILFEISYDWMRLYPNYKVNPIDIEGLYEIERSLFGIATTEGTTVIPGAYFMEHHHVLADILAGIFYLCWVPVPMGFGLWLYFKGERRNYLHFSMAFLFVNWVGFVGYYVHPAAPPWYALNFGFEPILSTPGNVAGLIRFDNLVGIPVFQSIYVNNSNIFAAVPSLHAAYMLVATIYAVLTHRSWPCVVLFSVITMGIWWTAVYSCHHYIIDVLLGIMTACFSVAVFERVLVRWRPFHRFLSRYESYISDN